MNEEAIFASFPGIGNVMASDVVRVVSYLHSKDIVHRNINVLVNVLINVLVTNYHYKS